MKIFYKNCLNCHKEFFVTSKNKQKKFCCHSCANGYNQRKKFTEDESIYNNGFNYFNTYVFGLILSDGCLSYCKHSKRLRITLTLNDFDVIKKIHDIWTPKKSIYKYKKSNSIVSNNSFDIKFLMKYGLTERKSSTVKMPNIPKKYFGSFLRGIFDGDGCVYINKTFYNNKMFLYVNCSITSGSLIFLEQLNKILEQDYKIQSKIYKDSRSECWNLRIRAKEYVEKFFNLIYQDDGLCLLRKKEKFKL